MPMLRPSVAINAGGLILVMWRNWLAGTRDMYLARSQDGVKLSTPEKLRNVAPHCLPDERRPPCLVGGDDGDRVAT